MSVTAGRVIDVLVVDDDEDDFVLVADLLVDRSNYTFRVDWVSDPDDCVDILLQDQHDVCLLDYRLGERNGIDVLRTAVRAGCRQPVIVLTGQGDFDVDAQALAAGAADYLVKHDLDAEKLERSVRYAVSHAQALAGLRHSEMRNRTLLNAIPDWIMRIQADGTVIDVNWPPGRGDISEWVGRPLFEQLPDEVAARLHMEIADALAGSGLKVVEFVADLGAGPLELEARILAVPETRELVVIARDIADRRAAERNFQELIESKDKFIASVSHELRTPLTAVVGFARLLQEATDDLSDSERLEMITSIVEQGSDLAELVDDLLVSARAEVGQLSIARVPVTLRAQVAQAIESVPPRSKHFAVEGEGAVVRADPIRVRQILRNLLTNAVKYGGPDVAIDLESRPGWGVVRVLDNGPGINQTEWEKIFQPYHRLNQPSTQPEAVGLGLSVARQLARRMDGDLDYAHRDGWSVFELTLPLLEAGT